MRLELVLVIILLLSISLFAQSSEVKIVGVDARLEDRNLIIEVLAINTGTRAQELDIATHYFDSTDNRIEVVPPDSTKKFTYTIHNTRSGTVTMAIEGGISKFIEIAVPNSTDNQALRVTEITREDAFIIQEGIQEQSPLFSVLVNPYYLGAIVGAIVLAIILVRAFILKSKSEKQMERNAELLEAADQASKGKNIKRKKIHMD
jgi:uncharacterized membrane protein YciS (DUF1049 family)